MLGEGHIGPANENGTLEYAVKTKHLYPYLVDAAGNWTVRKDVRNVFVMGSGNASFNKSKVEHNEWMTVTGKTIGPELGIGTYVGNFTKGRVMLLKSCIGDRALGWDLLPPGSERFEFNDTTNVTWVHAGYHDSPSQWKKGTQPEPIGWEAGEQYDGDTARAAHILAELNTYYPGATSYEVAGFFWWQGDRDARSAALSSRYEQNLVKLIKTLRKQFNAPNAKFVTASLGQTLLNDTTSGGGLILQAMLNVANKTKFPEFAGNVATVYTHPLEHTPGSSGGHYGDDAYTYMNVGEAMGTAMAGLLKGDAK